MSTTYLTTTTLTNFADAETTNQPVSVERIILFSLLGVGFTVVTIFFAKYIYTLTEKKSRIVPLEYLPNYGEDGTEIHDSCKNEKININNTCRIADHTV